MGHRQSDGAHSLGCGENWHDGVCLPELAPHPVTEAAPQVYDALAVHVGGACRSQFLARGEIVFEGGADRFKAGRGPA
jgi:hypothetical protein